MTAADVSSSNEVDEMTLERARRGERSARGVIATLYSRRVFALLSRMLVGRQHRTTCEDSAQETFLRVFKALPGFRSEGPARLSTWIPVIAARLAVAECRKPESTVCTEALTEDCSSHHPEGQMEIALAIERAMKSLSPSFRAAFLLREAHGLSYEEIAESLDIDLGTVKSRARPSAEGACRRPWTVHENEFAYE